MKKYIEIFLSLLPVLWACSCASGPAVIPEWPYEKDAIRLHLKSDSRLNLYQGTPHALLVCVYQLRDPNAFNQLTEEREGLPKLCECGRFDPSVASSKRFVIQPGQELTESLNRAEGAKYVGMVAGYYVLEKERVVRLLQFPVVAERKSLFSLGKILKPGVLNIDLYLGPQGIQEIREK